MIDIRALTLEEILKYDKELTRYMKMVLEENSSQLQDVESMAKNYYQNMIDFTKNGTAVLIGAFDEEQIIGFHWGYEVEIFGERRMHSYFNAVEYEYRKQKIGSMFFRKLEEITLEKGIKKIEAMCTYANKTAYDYHVKNGFEVERVKFLKEL